MIAAEEFVALLEAKDLLSPELLAHLRRQISRPDHPVSAALMAKWLVDRGHLSRIFPPRSNAVRPSYRQTRHIP